MSRYTALAYLASRYERQIIAFIAEHGHPVVVAILFALVAIAVAVFYFWQASKKKKRIWAIGERFF